VFTLVLFASGRKVLISLGALLLFMSDWAGMTIAGCGLVGDVEAIDVVFV
jgi:hypothetical protein